MTISEKINEIEKKAREVGLSPAKLCKLASIDRATYQRWKAGKTTPLWDNFTRLENALREGAKE